MKGLDSAFELNVKNVTNIGIAYAISKNLMQEPSEEAICNMLEALDIVGVLNKSIENLYNHFDKEANIMLNLSRKAKFPISICLHTLDNNERQRLIRNTAKSIMSSFMVPEYRDVKEQLVVQHFINTYDAPYIQFSTDTEERYGWTWRLYVLNPIFEMGDDSGVLVSAELEDWTANAKDTVKSYIKSYRNGSIDRSIIIHTPMSWDDIDFYKFDMDLLTGYRKDKHMLNRYKDAIAVESIRGRGLFVWDYKNNRINPNGNTKVPKTVKKDWRHLVVCWHEALLDWLNTEKIVGIYL